jgi:hypothetical protein
VWKIKGRRKKKITSVTREKKRSIKRTGRGKKKKKKGRDIILL